jgi:hypothetical protein
MRWKAFGIAVAVVLALPFAALADNPPPSTIPTTTTQSDGRPAHGRCHCHFAAGTLDAISTNKIRVHVERTGPYDKVLMGNEVTFDLGNANVPNLSIGDKVAILFSASGRFRDPNFDWQNATFTVLRLHVVHDKGEAGTNP